MHTQNIALVPEARGVDWSSVARVSAALQKQVVEHLGPIWEITATVDAFADLEDVPVGYWPIIVSPRPWGLGEGIYFDDNGQPYARVGLSADWSRAASRACLEMLVNPYGNRTLPASSPRSDQGPALFLLEICAPCAALPYVIGDQLVADFCTPAYFTPASHSAGARCSFQHSLCNPLQVLYGGHLSWYDPYTGSWWSRAHRGEHLVDLRLGARSASDVSLRDFVFARRLHAGQTPALPHGGSAPAMDRVAPAVQRTSRAHAQRLRAVGQEPVSERAAPVLDERATPLDPSTADAPIALEADVGNGMSRPASLTVLPEDVVLADEAEQIPSHGRDTPADRLDRPPPDGWDERADVADDAAFVDQVPGRPPPPLPAQSHSAASRFAPVSIAPYVQPSGRQSAWLLFGALSAGIIGFAVARGGSTDAGAVTAQPTSLRGDAASPSPSPMDLSPAFACVDSEDGGTDAPTDRVAEADIPPSAPGVAAGRARVASAGSKPRARPRRVPGAPPEATSEAEVGAGHADAGRPILALEALIETRR